MNKRIRIRPVTKTFNAGIAFKLMAPPVWKRAIKAHHSREAYLDRNGLSSLKYWADPAAAARISVLEQREKQQKNVRWEVALDAINGALLALSLGKR
jgi:hypothetical protein